MGIEMPAEVRWLIPIVVGDSWPEGDETALQRLAEVWRTAATDIDNAMREADDAVAQATSHMDGEAAEAFKKYWEKFVKGEEATLPKMKGVSEKLATACRNCAMQIEYAKLSIIIALVILAIQIAAMIASAVATFGASTAGIVPAQLATRAGVQIVFRQLVQQLMQQVGRNLIGKLAMQVGIEVATSVATDLAVQGIQLAKGTRSELDGKLTLDAAKSGLVSGAVGFGVGAGAGKALGDGVGDSIGRTIGRNAAEEAVTGMGSALVEGALSEEGIKLDDVLRAGTSGAVGGAVSGTKAGLDAGLGSPIDVPTAGDMPTARPDGPPSAPPVAPPAAAPSTAPSGSDSPPPPRAADAVNTSFAGPPADQPSHRPATPEAGPSSAASSSAAPAPQQPQGFQQAPATGPGQQSSGPQSSGQQSSGQQGSPAAARSMPATAPSAFSPSSAPASTTPGGHPGTSPTTTGPTPSGGHTSSAPASPSPGNHAGTSPTTAGPHPSGTSHQPVPVGGSASAPHGHAGPVPPGAHPGSPAPSAPAPGTHAPAGPTPSGPASHAPNASVPFQPAPATASPPPNAPRTPPADGVHQAATSAPLLPPTHRTTNDVPQHQPPAHVPPQHAPASPPQHGQVPPPQHRSAPPAAAAPHRAPQPPPPPHRPAHPAGPSPHARPLPPAGSSPHPAHAPQPSADTATPHERPARTPWEEHRRLTSPVPLPDRFKHLRDDVRHTRSGLSLHDDEFKAYSQSAAMVAPDPQRYTVDLHGSTDDVRVGGTRLTPEDLADIIRSSGDWDGKQPIRLVSCQTGTRSDGFAARLSQELGVDVVSPTKDAWVDDMGNVFASSSHFDHVRGDFSPGWPPNGDWVTFKPDGTSTRHDRPTPPGTTPSWGDTTPEHRPRAWRRGEPTDWVRDASGEWHPVQPDGHQRPVHPGPPPSGWPDRQPPQRQGPPQGLPPRGGMPAGGMPPGGMPPGGMPPGGMPPGGMPPGGMPPGGVPQRPAHGPGQPQAGPQRPHGADPRAWHQQRPPLQPPPGRHPQAGQHPQAGPRPQQAGPRPQAGPHPQAGPRPQTGQHPHAGQHPQHGPRPHTGQHPQARSHPTAGQHPQAGPRQHQHQGRYAPQPGQHPQHHGHPQHRNHPQHHGHPQHRNHPQHPDQLRRPMAPPAGHHPQQARHTAPPNAGPPRPVHPAQGPQPPRPPMPPAAARTQDQPWNRPVEQQRPAEPARHQPNPVQHTVPTSADAPQPRSAEPEAPRRPRSLEDMSEAELQQHAVKLYALEHPELSMSEVWIRTAGLEVGPDGRFIEPDAASTAPRESAQDAMQRRLNKAATEYVDRVFKNKGEITGGRNDEKPAFTPGGELPPGHTRQAPPGMLDGAPVRVDVSAIPEKPVYRDAQDLRQVLSQPLLRIDGGSAADIHAGEGIAPRNPEALSINNHVAGSAMSGFGDKIVSGSAHVSFTMDVDHAPGRFETNMRFNPDTDVKTESGLNKRVERITEAYHPNGVNVDFTYHDAGQSGTHGESEYVFPGGMGNEYVYRTWERVTYFDDNGDIHDTSVGNPRVNENFKWLKEMQELEAEL